MSPEEPHQPHVGDVAAMIDRIGAVLDATDEVRRMTAIGTGQPLELRLAEVLGVLEDYHRRVRADLSAVEWAGTPGARSVGTQDLRFLNDLPEIQETVAGLLRPDQHRLRLPAADLAEAFLILSRMATHAAHEGPDPLPADQVIALFLYGAVDRP